MTLVRWFILFVAISLAVFHSPNLFGDETTITIGLDGAATVAMGDSIDDIAGGDSTTFGVDLVVGRPTFEVQISIKGSAAESVTSSDESDFGRNILTLDRSGEFSAGAVISMPSFPATIDWFHGFWGRALGVSLYGTVADASWDKPDVLASRLTIGEFGIRALADLVNDPDVQNNSLLVRLSTGPTFRVIGGDILDEKEDLEKFLGDSTRFFFGWDVKAEIKINILTVFATFALMTSDVKGIRSGQLYAGIAISGDVVSFVIEDPEK